MMLQVKFVVIFTPGKTILVEIWRILILTPNLSLNYVTQSSEFFHKSHP